MIDTASILADRYKDNRGQLTAALMGQPVPDQQLDAYSALRAMQLLKESDRMAMAQQARGPSGEQPSLAEAAVTPDQPMGLAGMVGQPVMAQAQQAPMPQQPMQAASGGLASMPTPDDDYHEGGMVAFAAGGRPSSTDYMKQAMENIPQPTSIEEREAGMAKQRDYVNTLYAPDRMAPYLEDIAKERRELGAQDEKNVGYALLAAAKAVVDKPSTGKGLSSIVPGLAAAGAAFGSELQKFDKEKRDANRALRQSEMTLAAAQQARDDGKTDKAVALFNKYDDQNRDAQKMLSEVNSKNAQIQAGIENAQLQAQTAREGHAIQREGQNKPGLVERIMKESDRIRAEQGDAAAEAYEKKYARISEAGSPYKYNGPDVDARQFPALRAQFDKAVGILNLQKSVRGITPEEIADIDRKIAAEQTKFINSVTEMRTALGSSAGQPGTAPPTAQQAAPIKVTSKEQFAALPSGTTFVAPDGSVRTKP